MVSATTTWLAALATCPEPGGPMYVVALPRTSKTGCARATAGSPPPAPIGSAPPPAAGAPPGHDRQLSRSRGGLPAGHRGVDGRDAALGERRRDRARHGRGDRGHVDV